uniref:Uncharacterized protein n=1 Tax=Arundo donax TaxID=35708 RepID=A0A0A9CBT2_ARUDO
MELSCYLASSFRIVLCCCGVCRIRR